MVDGVAGGGAAGGDAELAVNQGQVPVDGAWADNQLFGDLGICQPLGHQAQHFDFTCGETIWVL